jgi:hypothetical protein
MGTGNAIAVDSKNVHIAYYSRGTATGVPPSVKYETFPLDLVALPVAQTVEALTINPSIIPPQAISIAIDSQGMPHIVYQDGQGGLKYAYIQNGIWTTEVIVSSGGGAYNALALDKNDAPHVAFGGLSYATRSTGPTGVVWNTEIISSVKTLTGVSMVVDSQGQPRVAWSQHTPNDVVVYAARGTGLWTQEFVSSVDSDWVSLAIDATDTPSVSFWGWNGGSGALTAEVGYATRMVSGSTAFWQTAFVDSINIPCCQPNPFDFNMTSLALSPTGDPRISYGSDAGVNLAKETTGTFSTQVIDAQPVDTFNFTSLAVDDTDAAHILFRSTSLNVCPTAANCLVYQKVVGPNTPVGFNVTVNPVDSSTGTSPVTVNFAQVTQAGTTSISSGGTLPSPPQGFLLGNPPVAYDVSTTALYLPPVTVCIHYGTSFANPANLSLMHYENGAWVDRTVSNDTVQHIICATTSSLSPLEVFQPSGSPLTSSTLLVSAPNASTYGQVVTFTATVSSSGSGMPTGTVGFLDGGAHLGTATVNSSGVATFSSSTLTAGSHLITAMYSGDTVFPGSTSSVLTQTITPAPLTITASSASVLFGSAIAPVSASYTGFANGESPANLTTMPVCVVVNLPANDAAGTYTTACSGAVDSNYTIGYVNGTLTITQATTLISWPIPAAITYGTPLSAAQLDATASVAGTLGYSPALGTVLNAGNPTLTVVFTPADTVDYKTATSQVSLTVNKAPLSITAVPAAGNNVPRPYGANNPPVSPVITGIVNGDPISATDLTSATPASPVGAYNITPVLSDPSNRLGNYTLTVVNGTLTVAPEATLLTVTLSPTSIVVGQSSTVTVTLTGPDMAIPIDPSVLAGITLTSSAATDVLSNAGMCTPTPGLTNGTASCVFTITATEPNGRTLTAAFAGSADLTASNNTAQLMVTEPVQGQQSCIASDFRNVAVAGGNSIWFNSIFRVRDVSKQKINIAFANSSVQFQYTDANGNLVPVSLAMPNAQIVIDPSVSVASTSFDAVNSTWVTTLPWDLDDNAFLSGAPWLIPAGGIPADVEPVTWCGTFAVDVPGAHIGWRWAAAAYSSFSSSNNTLGVKPMDTDHDNQTTNHDHAGTPENYIQFVIPGARGKGGKNYTGTYSRSAAIE